MNKNDLIKILTDSGIEPNEAQVEAYLIIEKFLNKKKEDLILMPDFESIEALNAAYKRAQTKKPVQYILNSAYFMGEKYYVDENVLIPRDDTEILVREAAKYIKDRPKILDIGTGSGIIACSLAKLSNKKAEILAIDISNNALHIAFKNAKNMGLTGIITFRKSDIFSNIREKFDIMVSNPPYIPHFMKNKLQKEVLFEPPAALFAKDELGLEFYQKIIKNAKNFLNPGGIILFEVMENQAEYVIKILEKENFNDIRAILDMQGIKRVVSGAV